MAFCENCGKPVYPLDTVCSGCGTPVKQPAQSAPVSVPPSAGVRTGDVEPPSGSPYAVLGSWGFVGSMLLMLIPIVGFIMTIVWASGGAVNLNRRNLARGYLILMGLGVVVYLIFFAALAASGGSALLSDYLPN